MPTPQKYFTYVVKCSDGTYYTGKTADLAKRLLQHNGKLSGGAKYTRTRRPVELVYVEELETNTFACQKEAEIKRMPRKKKEALIFHQKTA